MNLEEIKKKIKLYRLKYLKRKNRFDLIAKMNLKVIFPELTEEILSEYGPTIIKYLEKQTPWGYVWNDNLSNWYLFNYLLKNNKLDIIVSFKLTNSFRLNEIYPELTEEILTEYGLAIIKYLENQKYSPWSDNLSNWYLFNYLLKNNKLDLIDSIHLISSFRLDEIYPELTEEILTEYGLAIIKYLESANYSPWHDECLLKYLMKPEINRFDLIAKMNLKYTFPKLTEETLTEYGPAIIKYLEIKDYSPWRVECLLKYLMKPEINRFDLIAKMNLTYIFSKLTEEILTEYGPAIIKYLENQKYLPWHDNLSNWYLFNYLLKNNELDLIASFKLTSSFRLNEIYPELTEEILTEYGPAIIKYLESVNYLPWHDECLLKYLMKPEINRFDLIAKMDLQHTFPKLTKEILTEYQPAIIKYLERVYYLPWHDEYFLKYLKENNRFDLIAKMNLKYTFPKLTEEILSEYGPAIIKHLEIVDYLPWSDNLSNWYLYNYLLKNNELDLIDSLHLTNSFNLNEIYPKLTEEILKKYGPAIIKYLEREKYLPRHDNLSNWYLFNYLLKNNELDLITSLKLVNSFRLKEIYPKLTEEILTEYGPAIIKYIESVDYVPWYDECLLKYLMKPEINRLDLIADMYLTYTFPELTEEILSKYGPVIIKYLERVYYLTWHDKCLLEYLKENGNRLDLIAKMNLKYTFPALTEEILTEYGPAIIKYLEIVDCSSWHDKFLLEYLIKHDRFDLIAKINLEYTFPELTKEILTEYESIIIKYLERVDCSSWHDKFLLEYLIKHDRFDLIKKLSLNFENVENIFPELEDSLKITMENLRYQLSYLYNRNDEIFSTLNFKILKLDVPEEVLSTITLYPDIQEKIINLDKVVSSKLFEIIKKVQSKKYDTAQVTESILNNVSNYKDLLNNLDVNSLNENELNNLIYILQNENNIFNISSIEDLKEENFKRKKDNYFRNIDNNLDNIDLDSLKEAIVESIYGISLYQAYFIIRRYSYYFDVLRKDGLDEKIITIVENLNKIVNETDILKLKAIYQARNDIPSLENDFMSSLSLEASIRKEYSKMYSNTLYKVDEKDLSQNPKLNNVTYKGKKVEIYEPGGDFRMQIHALGAYNPDYQKPDNFKDDWLKPKIAYHGICTSYIANNEIATARQEHPILGFSNYEEKALLLAGNHDLGSNRANKLFATSKFKPYKFLPPKTMIDATRHNHNEMVIERIKQDSMSKRTPNYIVYIIDDINNSNNFDINNQLYQENLQAAYDFDIPIVVVDRLKYAKHEKENCDSLEREFNGSRNPETLRELFLNYMNNWVGCRKFEKNPEAEYNEIFNDEVVYEFYKRITDLIKNDIREMKDVAKTNEEILMMIKLLQHERDCRILSTHDGKREPFSIDNAINEYQELLKEFKAKLTALKQNEVTQDVVLEETVSKTM